MKERIMTAAIIMFAVSFISCSKKLVGSGRNITEDRHTPGFTGITNNGDFKVTVTRGTATSLSLHGEDNILSEIATEVHNNRLTIRYRENNIRHRHEQVMVSIVIPDLNYLSVNGSGSANSTSTWLAQEFFSNISGSGEIDVTAKATFMKCTVSGSGDVVLHGEAERGEFTISGSGNIKAFDVIAKEASATISGSGSTQISVGSKLNANISGSGKIYYKGNPGISSTVSGSGKVIKQ